MPECNAAMPWRRADQLPTCCSRKRLWLPCTKFSLLWLAASQLSDIAQYQPSTFRGTRKGAKCVRLGPPPRDWGPITVERNRDELMQLAWLIVDAMRRKLGKVLCSCPELLQVGRGWANNLRPSVSVVLPNGCEHFVRQHEAVC